MDADVLVVGYGPVGQLAANLLGAAGLRTLVLERAHGLHPLPRAAALDDEALRILQAAGLAERASVGMLANVPVELVTRGGAGVRLVDSADTANGQPYVSTLHQPALERVLDAGARARREVEVRWGAEVVAIDQEGDRVSATQRDGTTVAARALIACDGARSQVRGALGIPFGGSTWTQPWLVVDLLLDQVRAEPPVLRFVGDPSRPKVSVPTGVSRHRWEFMALPGEDLEALAAPRRVRELLAPHVDLARVALERATVYTFHARTAERWRDGRVLLAGDAAHVMPPFAGQGLCSGLRDVHNLVWKLAAVLDGTSGSALLDTYEAERRPHVEEMSRLAVRMGAVLQTRRPRAAALRDGVLTALSGAPVLGARARSGSLRPHARMREGAFGLGGGRLFAQGLVDGVRLDAALPAGRWALLGAGQDPHAGLGLAARRAFADAAGLPVDPAWLGGAELVVLRPDRFVFAADVAAGTAAAAAYRRLIAADPSRRLSDAA